ncbi:hypothetical protein PoB_002288200, partial [Plakobranchus ocellatus]
TQVPAAMAKATTTKLDMAMVSYYATAITTKLIVAMVNGYSIATTIKLRIQLPSWKWQCGNSKQAWLLAEWVVTFQCQNLHPAGSPQPYPPVPWALSERMPPIQAVAVGCIVAVWSRLQVCCLKFCCAHDGITPKTIKAQKMTTQDDSLGSSRAMLVV